MQRKRRLPQRRRDARERDRKERQLSYRESVANGPLPVPYLSSPRLRVFAGDASFADFSASQRDPSSTITSPSRQIWPSTRCAAFLEAGVAAHPPDGRRPLPGCRGRVELRGARAAPAASGVRSGCAGRYAQWRQGRVGLRGQVPLVVIQPQACGQGACGAGVAGSSCQSRLT